ncbi:hypothetical protein [Psittacicella gerlachiana]|uniref:Uncharacterized protein n=1 Tax=Psittacicella gerlachiana TaxID=2028574 RepID=A0A3A1YBS5_9GAMM|nr:hypothetical protein [Psittacicella gerlachiana]RIY34826.1 hypothetical protein CKF59_04675 [Psittacicella gerlachiana]
MQKRKLTRAEANELSWALKKKKKRTGNTSGSRSNPNAKNKAQVVEKQTEAKQKPARAIPIYIPGRDKPLVNEQLQTVSQAKAQEVAQATGQNQDMVMINGELVATSTLQAQARAKARKQAREQEKKEATPAFDFAKLGKAQLRLLEKAGVEPGKEAEFFAQLAAEKKSRKEAKNTTPQHAEKEDRRIKSRDYKAGRNTDYSATQAQAEKLLAQKKTKKKEKLSGDELLDLWENTQW